MSLEPMREGIEVIQSGHQQVGGSGLSLSYAFGGHRGHYVKRGTIIFSSPTHQDMIWHNIQDPDSLVRLVKSLKKQLCKS